MKQTEKSSSTSSSEIATNYYDPSDYKSSKEIEKGLATTHEQVSDAYVEGTIDGEIDDIGKNADIDDTENK